jgi:hypothetical protein
LNGLWQDWLLKWLTSNDFQRRLAAELSIIRIRLIPIEFS